MTERAFEELPTRDTDRINGQDVARHLEGRAIWVPELGRFWYDGTRWVRDTVRRWETWTGELADRLAALAETQDDPVLRGRVRRLESARGIQGAFEFAEPQLLKYAVELDAHPHLLNTPTGTVDLDAGDERPHDPLDYLTKSTSVALNPRARSKMLEDVMTVFVSNAEHRRYVFKVLGSCLVGGNPWRLLVIIKGSTSSGKSTLAEGVAAALGDYAVPVSTSVFRGSHDDKPRPDLLRALDARLAYASEASHSWELHADQVKRMTGGDPIVARAMRSNVMVEKVPSFTPLIVTNEMPHLKGADAAVRRRLQVLPFLHGLEVGEEDPTFKDRFVADQDAREALLRQLVLGCRTALQEGLDDPPREFILATADAFESLDHVVAFVSWLEDGGQLRQVDPAACSLRGCWKASDLHVVYGTWVTLHGDPEDRRTKLNLRRFGDRLRELGWTSGKAGGVRWSGKEQTVPKVTSQDLGGNQ